MPPSTVGIPEPVPQEKSHLGAGTVARFYTLLAIVVLNTLCLLVAINLLLGAYYALRGFSSQRHRPPAPSRLFNDDGSPVNNGKRSKYQLIWFDYNACKEFGPAYVADVLDDFDALADKGFIYQPWVQFSEPLFKGTRVNVALDEWGFPIRRTINPPTDGSTPVIRILTLGGSTTFGYNVADEHTWPSFLSQILNERARASGRHALVEVVNYGRGYYEPSQEMVLITDLLKSGHRPNLVIFMDGVNWGPREDIPQWSRKLECQFVQAQQPVSDWAHVKSLRLDWLPMARFAKSISQRFGSHPEAKNEDDQDPTPTDEDVDRMLKRFEQDRRISSAICRTYGAKSLFFIQPDAMYNYPTNLYRGTLPEWIIKAKEARRKFHQQVRHQPGVVYLGDLFEAWGLTRKALVDAVHYSPAFNRFVAEKVASYIDVEKLPVSPKAIDQSAATGSHRQSASIEHCLR
jgi:hypothetical protein